MTEPGLPFGERTSSASSQPEVAPPAAPPSPPFLPGESAWERILLAYVLPLVGVLAVAAVFRDALAGFWHSVPPIVKQGAGAAVSAALVAVGTPRRARFWRLPALLAGLAGWTTTAVYVSMPDTGGASAGMTPTPSVALVLISVAMVLTASGWLWRLAEQERSQTWGILALIALFTAPWAGTSHPQALWALWIVHGTLAGLLAVALIRRQPQWGLARFLAPVTMWASLATARGLSHLGGADSPLSGSIAGLLFEGSPDRLLALGAMGAMAVVAVLGRVLLPTGARWMLIVALLGATLGLGAADAAVLIAAALGLLLLAWAAVGALRAEDPGCERYAPTTNASAVVVALGIPVCVLLMIPLTWHSEAVWFPVAAMIGGLAVRGISAYARAAARAARADGPVLSLADLTIRTVQHAVQGVGGDRDTVRAQWRSPLWVSHLLLLILTPLALDALVGAGTWMSGTLTALVGAVAIAIVVRDRQRDAVRASWRTIAVAGTMESQRLVLGAALTLRGLIALASALIDAFRAWLLALWQHVLDAIEWLLRGPLVFAVGAMAWAVVHDARQPGGRRLTEAGLRGFSVGLLAMVVMGSGQLHGHDGAAASGVWGLALVGAAWWLLTTPPSPDLIGGSNRLFALAAWLTAAVHLGWGWVAIWTPGGAPLLLAPYLVLLALLSRWYGVRRLASALLLFSVFVIGILFLTPLGVQGSVLRVVGYAETAAIGLLLGPCWRGVARMSPPAESRPTT